MILYHAAKEALLDFPIHPLGRLLSKEEIQKINIERAKQNQPLVRSELRVGEIGRRFSTDFGVGFYLTNDKTFAGIHACSAGRPGNLYTFEYDLDAAMTYTFSVTDLRWLVYIAFNRGSFKRSFAPALYDSIVAFKKQYDIICGPTANDKYYNLIQYFLSYETDEYLRIGHSTVLRILDAAQLPTQYTFLTASACSELKLISEHHFTANEYSYFNSLADQRKNERLALTDHMLAVSPNANIGYTLEGLVRVLERAGVSFENIPVKLEYDVELSAELKQEINAKPKNTNGGGGLGDR